MPKHNLEKIIKGLYEKKITPDEALKKLKSFPTEDIGFANIDHHRILRQGFPEVIYCEGKADGEVVAIVKKIIAEKQTVLATRATKALYQKIKKFAPKAKYHQRAMAIVIEQKRQKRTGYVLVLSAGTSDIPVAEEAAITADVMGSKVVTVFDVGVAGIHRLFEHSDKFEKARVIVVVAGMDGALASVVGGLVSRPVVAVPTSIGYGASFGGISALLAMLNSCSAGVAVMNIDNGFGAGTMAHKINSLPESFNE